LTIFAQLPVKIKNTQFQQVKLLGMEKPKKIPRTALLHCIFLKT